MWSASTRQSSTARVTRGPRPARLASRRRRDAGLHPRADAGNPAPTQPGTFGAYVVAEDIDGLHARVAAAGAEITTPPHTTDYGSRDFAIRDPEGNRWSFGTYRGEPVED
jgi:uncharacterized glyoxalase superfamily protein PhnB